MANVRRILVIKASRAATANNWIANQDIHGAGGERTFDVPLWLLNKDPATDPPAAYWCNWNLKPAWWNKISDKVAQAGWVVNSAGPGGDISHYKASNWTAQEVLDDTTRKRVALKVDDTEPNL